jgi:hypothetical protein
MPFSKYAVDPEQIEAMRAAFHRLCDVLRIRRHTVQPVNAVRCSMGSGAAGPRPAVLGSVS